MDLQLKYIGNDQKNRCTYIDQNNQYWKLLDCRYGRRDAEKYCRPHICKNIQAEPENPISVNYTFVDEDKTPIEVTIKCDENTVTLTDENAVTALILNEIKNKKKTTITIT